jgi:hypothetical protein
VAASAVPTADVQARTEPMQSICDRADFHQSLSRFGGTDVTSGGRTAVTFRFVVDLRGLESDRGPHGPTFHRWLPRGRQDAIALLDASETRLRVWLDDTGFINDGLVTFHQRRTEVDRDIVGRQGWVESGNAQAELQMHVATTEVGSLCSGSIPNPSVVPIAERVVKTIDAPLSRLVDILRINYGQYWLSRWTGWNPSKQSLGSFCFHLRLRVTSDGKEAVPVIPDMPQSFGQPRIVAASFQDYMRPDDWAKIQELVRADYSPTTAVRVIALAHHLLEEGNLRHALVEAASAVELAIPEGIHAHYAGRTIVLQQLGAIANMKLKPQIVAVAAQARHIGEDLVQSAVEAVDLRNAVVHEGKEIGREAEPLVRALLAFAQALLATVPIKCPTRELFNRVDDDWDSPTGAHFGNISMSMNNPADLRRAYALDPDVRD